MKLNTIKLVHDESFELHHILVCLNLAWRQPDFQTYFFIRLFWAEIGHRQNTHSGVLQHVAYNPIVVIRIYFQNWDMRDVDLPIVQSVVDVPFDYSCICSRCSDVGGFY